MVPVIWFAVTTGLPSGAPPMVATPPVRLVPVMVTVPPPWVAAAAGVTLVMVAAAKTA